jgi:hypothetical protein
VRSSPSSASRSKTKYASVVPSALAEAFCSAWKLVRPSGSTMATSPSSSAVSNGSVSAARAIGAKRSVQSLPLRESSCTPASIRQPMR